MLPKADAPRPLPSPLLLLTASLFVATLVASNVLAAKVAAIGPLTVTGAIVLFPLAYLFGDVLTEVWGYAVARMVIWTGFTANIVIVVFIWAAIALPSAASYHAQSAFATVLGSTPRLVGASVVAYLVGEFVNSYLLAKLKVRTEGRFLWMRTIGSTIVGQGLDTAIFTTLAFIGVIPGDVVLAIIGSNWLIKVVYETAATPLTYAIVNHLKRVEQMDHFDRTTDFSPVALRSLRRVAP